MYDFEVKQLYAYRQMILSQKRNFPYILKKRPEIVHTVATKFEKDIKEPANLWKIFKETKYYKTRFESSQTYEDILKQIKLDSKTEYNKVIRGALKLKIQILTSYK